MKYLIAGFVCGITSYFVVVVTRRTNWYYKYSAWVYNRKQPIEHTAHIIYDSNGWIIIWASGKIVVNRSFDTKLYAETWLDGYNHAKESR